MSKITPFLWFEKGAEDAANYYVEVFPNSKILSTSKYEGEDVVKVSGMPEQSVMSVELELDGTHFSFLNGGKIANFDLNSSAVSFIIGCETQEEIDHFWEKLSAVPEAEQCGWCKDRFGVTWQVVPKQLGEWLSNPDPEIRQRVTKAFLQMKKFDITKLEDAARGK